MIVDDFDLMTVTILPDEANPDLIIDSDTMLSSSAPLQGFEPISEVYQEIHKLRSVVHHTKLPPGKILKLFGIAFDRIAKPNALSVLRLEGTYHFRMVSSGDTIVKIDYFKRSSAAPSGNAPPNIELSRPAASNMAEPSNRVYDSHSTLQVGRVGVGFSDLLCAI